MDSGTAGVVVIGLVIVAAIGVWIFYIARSMLHKPTAPAKPKHEQTLKPSEMVTLMADPEFVAKREAFIERRKAEILAEGSEESSTA